MKRFELTMMCTSCKWKISEELKQHGYDDFDIDMESSTLNFEHDVDASAVIRIVNNIGYKIETLPETEEYSDEELALLEDAIRNGY
jgi:copper chaperone CopZ